MRERRIESAFNHLSVANETFQEMERKHRALTDVDPQILQSAATGLQDLAYCCYFLSKSEMKENAQKSVQLAKLTKNANLQIRILSFYGFITATLGEDKVSDDVFFETQAIMEIATRQGTLSPEALGLFQFFYGKCRLADGKLLEAEKHLKSAMHALESRKYILPNEYDDLCYLLCLLYYYIGDCGSSMSMASKLVSGTQQAKEWSTSTNLMCLLLISDSTNVALESAVADAKAFLASNTKTSAQFSILLCVLLAQALIRQNNNDEAFNLIQMVINMVNKKPYAVRSPYLLSVTYLGFAELFLCISDFKGLADSFVKAVSMVSNARNGLTIHRELLWKGIVAFVKGNSDEASQLWMEGYIRAKAMEARFDMVLLNRLWSEVTKETDCDQIRKIWYTCISEWQWEVQFEQQKQSPGEFFSLEYPFPLEENIFDAVQPIL